MNDLNDVLGNITEFLKTETKTETIIGQQFTLGEFTCIPVMSIGLGFGGGGGEGKGVAKGNEGQGVGTGGGGGLGMGPVGFLVTKGTDIQFISTRSGKGLNAIFEKLPELLDKYLEKTQKTAPV
jgi:uncharacterized spore protein YtfJ